MHCSYWYSSAAHIIPVILPFDWAAASHNYTVAWAPTSITWSVDDVVVHVSKGTADVTIPWEAGQALIIQRPLTPTYDGDSLFTMEWMQYSPAY